MANRTKFTQEKKDEICKAIMETGDVSRACIMCNVSRTAAYDHRNADPDFAEAWDEAYLVSVELMEAEARRRAVEGVLEPVFYQGEQVALVRKYSDTLLMFMLKGAKPEKYRDTSHVTLAGDQKSPMNVHYQHDPAQAAREIIAAHGLTESDVEAKYETGND